MTNIFDRNYKAVQERGLITPQTTDYEFWEKLSEELSEAGVEIRNDDNESLNNEIADCLVVCSNWLIHRGVNIEQILIKIAEKNEKRKI